ncbi:MAG TPA: hypothetical protein VIV60_33480, partial [Polyangiaceae bacterium]
GHEDIIGWADSIASTLTTVKEPSWMDRVMQSRAKDASQVFRSGYDQGRRQAAQAVQDRQEVVERQRETLMQWLVILRRRAEQTIGSQK